GFFAHAERLQRVAPDRAQRTHVRVLDAVKQANGRADDVPRNNLVHPQAAGLTSSAQAGADDEIVAAREDGRNDRIEILRIVAAVAVHERDYLARWCCAARAGETCSAISGTRLDKDAGAGLTCPRHRVVAAAAIDDDDLVDDVAGSSAYDVADRLAFVEHGN